MQRIVLDKTTEKLSPNTISFAKRAEFSKSKLAMSLDYIFGKNTSKALDYSAITFQHSRRTGRLRYVLESGSQNVLFSFRPNGSIAPSRHGFLKLLSKCNLKTLHNRPRWSITVLNDVSPVVSRGKTVFSKHVVCCSDQLRAGEDVAILNEKGELLAAGKSILAGQTIKQFKRGAAVKVREGNQIAPDES